MHIGPQLKQLKVDIQFQFFPFRFTPSLSQYGLSQISVAHPKAGQRADVTVQIDLFIGLFTANRITNL